MATNSKAPLRDGAAPDNDSASAAAAGSRIKERRTLEQRLAEAQEIVARLTEEKREKDKLRRESEQKELLQIIRAEKLDEFAPNVWRSSVAELRAVLSKAR